MGSRRAARPSRFRARSGPKTRGPALAVGVVAALAGVGITVAVVSGEDGDASDRVVANSADRTPGTGDGAGSAAPLASASASPSTTATAPNKPSWARPARCSRLSFTIVRSDLSYALRAE